MKTRSWVLPLSILTLLACLALIFFAYYPRVRTAIATTHTKFLMTQVRDIMPEGRGMKTQADLVTFISSKRIDWNSCRLDGGEILDAWGVSMRVMFRGSAPSITLISAGPDRRFDTSDDLMETICN